MADHALRVGDVDHADVTALLATRAGLPGVARARRSFSLVDPRRESWLESWSLVTFHLLGVPMPVPQVTVVDEEDRFVARVDAYWPEHGVVGEADGSVKYDLTGSFVARDATSADDVLAWGQRQLDRQRLRHERLLDLGLTVVRWSAQDVAQNAEQLADRVHLRLSRGRELQRGRVLLPPPLPWQAEEPAGHPHRA